MTGCLYISPPRDPNLQDVRVISTIFADTRVTIKGLSDDAELIVPANILPQKSDTISNARVIRKLNIYGDLAIALAGPIGPIETVLTSIPDIMPELLMSKRPMRVLGDKVNMLNDTLLPTDHVHMIACMPSPKQGPNIINFVSRFDSEYIGKLGRCASIGTGRHDLINICKNYTGNLEDDDNVTRAKILAGTINGVQLAKELVGDKTNHWGGYVEWAHWDGDIQKWSRGPSSAHLFFYIEEVPGGYTAIPAPRILLYAKEETHSRILAAAIDNEVSIVRNYYLDSITDPHPAKYEASPLNFWRLLRPETITITLIGRRRDGTFDYAPRVILTNNPEDILDIEFSDNIIRWKIRDSDIDNLASEFIELHGMEYIPQYPKPETKINIIYK